jgi:SAM-dependent methyltransferase
MGVMIEQPDDDIARLPSEIRGWIATEAPEPTVTVRANGRSLPFTLAARPDVRLAFPDQPFVAGIQARLVAAALTPCDTVQLEIRADGDFATASRVLHPAAIQAIAAQAVLRDAARDKCISVLACPRCRAERASLTLSAETIICQICGETITQDMDALNLVPATSRPRILDAERMVRASREDNSQAEALIARTTKAGGWVLEIGSGDVRDRVRNVVRLAAADVPSTDIVAVDTFLPFIDACFDAVVAHDVFAAASDLPAAAAEIARVLRPGGEFIATAGFLRPAGAVAGHRLDLTAAGLSALFGATVETIGQSVPRDGHPVHVLGRLASAYLRALPEAAAAQAGAMTLAELAQMDPMSEIAEPLDALGSAARAALAGRTILHGRRRD